MDEREHRIRERAHRLWEEEGRPHGRAEQHWYAAKEMVAIEESQTTTLQPIDAQPDAEPIEAVINTGEFPTLTDQGEQQVPHFPGTDAGGEIPAPHVEPSPSPAPKAAKAASKAAAKPAVKPAAKAASTPAPKAAAKPAAKPTVAAPKTAAAPAAPAPKKATSKKVAPKKAPA